MSKHTPGPWKVIRTENAVSVFPASDREAQEGYTITHSDRPIHQVITGFNNRDCREVANARIIAASPLMYSAIKAFLDKIPKPDMADPAFTPEVEGLMNALAAADGEDE